MSSINTAPQPGPTTGTRGKNGARDQFIERQLRQTSAHVKLVDLCSSLMVLAAGALGFLLVVALVDHWVVSLGAVGRWLALLALLAGAAYYFGVAIMPLILGRINPVYAARAIEHAEPTLKNSLINYLLFRSDRAGVRMGVYQALEQRAANDLSHVNADTAVDRSRMIRIGYALIAVLVLCAAYTMLAPKSPFQSIARVLAPWAEIARPTRVRIEQVQPGNVQVFQGQSVTVSAHCYELREDEPVTLFCSTLDGQIIADQQTMQASEDGLVYRCTLPETGDGLQQDLVYWISAGDATTASYRVRVSPAPSILVEQIEYDFPAYTRLPDRVAEDRGDIQAVEGTKVTVRARANKPIAAAVLEFDPSHDAIRNDDSHEAAPRNGLSLGASAAHVEMEFREQQAWCSFYLEMDAARVQPKHNTYHVRFLAADGYANPHPVLHRLGVIRDLSPEIEILTPAAQRLEIPEDGRQRIEIRAIDPDFGLSSVTLRAVAGGQEIVNAVLLEDGAGVSGQSIVNFEFQPAAFGLRAGDAVTYWAVAADNRRSQPGGDAAPNIAKTGEQTFVITPPEQSPPAEPQQPGDERAEEPATDGSRQPDPTLSETAAPGDAGESSSAGDQTGGDQSGGQQQDGPSDSSGGSASDGSGTGQDSASGQQSGTGSSGTDGGSQSSGRSSQGNEAPASSSAGNSPSDGSSGSAAGNDGSGGDGSSGSQSASGSPSSASSGGNSTPSDSASGPQEPLHDGEVFEQALDYLRQQDDGRAASPSDQPPGPDAQPTDRASDAARQPDEPADGNPQDAGTGEESQSPSSAAEQGSSEAPGTGEQQGKPTDQPADAASARQPADGQQPKDSAEAQGQSGNNQQSPDGGSKGSPSSGTNANTDRKKSSGTPTGNPNQSGAGQQQQAKSGKGNPQESNSGGSSQNKPDGKKPPSAGGGAAKSSEQPKTPSPSQPQSSAQGEDSSDRSGGGSSGAGQGADQAGSDTPGSNSPSDSGAGAAEQSGSGDPSSGSGEAQQAPDATGQTGERPGSGSVSMPGAGGSGGTGVQGESDQNSQTPPVSPAASEGQPRKSGPGVPYGGGVPSTGDLQGFDVTGEVPPGEKPNLEYARKATNMVLEYLKDQQQNPDQELLERLGWSPQDMQDFIQRWEAMKRSAVEAPAAERELDEALRSLGLRPRGRGPRSASVPDAARSTMRNTGARSSPPAGYAEQFNAFRRGTARVPDE